MLKVLVLPVLLALSLTVACTAMSLEDYAEECGEWIDDYGDVFSGSGSVSELEDALEDWKALSPPGEVRALHDLREEGLGLFLDHAEEQEALEDQLDDLRDELDDAPRSRRGDIRDEMDDLEDKSEDRFDDLQDLIDDLEDDYEDEYDDLPRRVRRDLEDEGCL